MTDFERLVIDILIGLEVMEFVRTAIYLFEKVKPLFFSRVKRKREYKDD